MTLFSLLPSPAASSAASCSAVAAARAGSSPRSASTARTAGQQHTCSTHVTCEYVSECSVVLGDTARVHRTHKQGFLLVPTSTGAHKQIQDLSRLMTAHTDHVTCHPIHTCTCRPCSICLPALLCSDPGEAPTHSSPPLPPPRPQHHHTRFCRHPPSQPKALPPLHLLP